MDPDAELLVPPASQDNSNFPPPEPLPGASLYDLEVARREKLRRRGRIGTGCGEIDEAVLLGGFERGSVVGISAEDVDFGLLVGLQTAAHAVVSGTAKQQVAVITTLAAPAILPTLRDVIRAQVQAKLGPAATHQQAAVNAEVRRCLELISVSRVFDVEGLWEVISELETPSIPDPVHAAVTTTATDTMMLKENDNTTTIDDGGNGETPPSSPLELLSSSPSWDEAEEERRSVPAEAVPSPSPARAERIEVGDSEEDEDEILDLSQSPSPPSHAQESVLPPSHSSPPPPNPPNAPHTQAPLPEPNLAGKKPEKKYQEEIVEPTKHVPDLILITHFSTLLSNLFTRAADNKATAHTTLQLLSSHLRYLARSSGSLIMLLNTTSSTSTSTYTTTAPARPLEPTLRSIFNSAPPGIGTATGSTSNNSSSKRSSNNNKPAFGATFAQFLDLHLLCTRVPRTRGDAEAAFGTVGEGKRVVRYAWVVEVLLDELGVWVDGDGGKKEGEGGGVRVRRNREQRWGAVDVRGGVVVVDSFPRG